LLILNILSLYLLQGQKNCSSGSVPVMVQHSKLQRRGEPRWFVDVVFHAQSHECLVPLRGFIIIKMAKEAGVGRKMWLTAGRAEKVKVDVALRN